MNFISITTGVCVYIIHKIIHLYFSFICTIVRFDYSQASIGNVIFTPEGPNEQTVQLSVDEDQFLEFNETYLLRLDLPEASITAGAQIGSNNQARVTIINDDSKIVGHTCNIILYTIKQF